IQPAQESFLTSRDARISYESVTVSLCHTLVWQGLFFERMLQKRIISYSREALHGGIASDWVTLFFVRTNTDS
ncbi:MAG: hypothetical protein WBZ42_03645, partial [Halobacteriota archaeon]